MSEIITHYRGRYLSLLEKEGWEFASRSNASGVVVLVPVTEAGEILLVEQYRKPVAARVIELPAGLVGDHENSGESVLDAARRELEEETGYAMRMRYLSAPARRQATKSLHFVLATGLTRVGPGGGDPSESIEVLPVPLSRVDDWLDSRQAEGKPIDPKIYAALYWLQKSGHHVRC
jgi:ADP-ribose pyrophosphatase